MSGYSQPACGPCFAERNPGRVPHRPRDPDTERCCYCGVDTASGSYVREYPNTVPFPSGHPDRSQSLADRPVDLNAERKRRAGLADTGACPQCGSLRLFCRNGCQSD